MKSTSGLKLLLKTQDMSQGDLAQLLNVSQGLVSQWSTGKAEMPKNIQLKIIALIKEKNQTQSKIKGEMKPSQEVVPTALEDKIQACKNYCLEKFGFEVVIVK